MKLVKNHKKAEQKKFPLDSRNPIVQLPLRHVVLDLHVLRPDVMVELRFVQRLEAAPFALHSVKPQRVRLHV